jgi:hypothetical protein
MIRKVILMFYSISDRIVAFWRRFGGVSKASRLDLAKISVRCLVDGGGRHFVKLELQERNRNNTISISALAKSWTGGALTCIDGAGDEKAAEARARDSPVILALFAVFGRKRHGRPWRD